MIKPKLGLRRQWVHLVRSALRLSYGFLGPRLCFLRATPSLLFIFRPVQRITKSLANMDSS